MRLTFCLLFVLVIISMNAQRGYLDRLVFDPALKPFYHGVASGDPTDDSVIIWTRVTTSKIEVSVDWRVATDIGMGNVVASGTTTTNPDRDYTVKIDVSGLDPDTYYYYEFAALGFNSQRGRTKTAPTGNNQQARFAVVSCSNYAHGYFNAYREITTQNDVDAVLHLGDYIYEYGDGEYGDERVYAPDEEIYKLSNYRMRYSYYRLDPDLRDLHQQYPFITVWDDHESANDSYKDGAQNHDRPREGAWADRKAAAIKAYMEWQPIRENVSDNTIIFRKYSYGDLVDLIFLDTRLYGRDNASTILGATQYNWLTTQLQNSTAQWRFIAQQVMIAPLEIAGIAINNDQWDGFDVERSNLLNFITSNNIDNVVVLTGDIHTAWANDIPVTGYNDNGNNPCSGSVGTEFVTTSVTSPGLDFLGGLGEAVIQGGNDHIHYTNLSKRGYMIVDVTPNQTQADWRFLSTVTNPSYTIDETANWRVFDGVPCVEQASGPTIAPTNVVQQAQAPYDARTVDELDPDIYVFGWNEGAENTISWKHPKGVTWGKGYAIERSTDGKYFTEIGQVQALHTADFNFVDNTATAPTNYYRLKQVGGNTNSIRYSNIIHLNTLNSQREGIAAGQIDIFPNPTPDFAFCSFHADELADIKIDVVDVQGQILKQMSYQSTIGHNYVQVDLSTFAEDVYAIRLTRNGEPLASKLVLKLDRS